MSPIPYILDVDTGIDDALAILYVLASPSARLLGVSSVAGNVDLARATRNTRAVLALVGRSEIPVWPGCAAALLHAPAEQSIIHGESGLGHAVLPEPAPDPAPTHAIDAIVAAAREHAGELVLVATGPLTNIAAALIRDPDLPRRLKRLVVMGGAFREAGNVTPTAEFNIWCDPEAARIVFRAFGGAGFRADRRRRARRDPPDADRGGGSRRARHALRGSAARPRTLALPRGVPRATISI